MSTVQLYNPFDNLEVLRNSANLFSIAGETVFNHKTLLDIVKRAFVFLSAVFFFSEVKGLVEHFWAVYNQTEHLNFIRIAIALVNMAFVISPIAYLMGMRHWVVHLLGSSSIVVPYATKLFYDPSRENCDKMLKELKSNRDSALGTEAGPRSFDVILDEKSKEKNLSKNDLLQNIVNRLKDESIEVEEYRALLNALISQKLESNNGNVNNNSKKLLNELQDEKTNLIKKIKKCEKLLSDLDKFILFATENYGLGHIFVSQNDRTLEMKAFKQDPFPNPFELDLEFIQEILKDPELTNFNKLQALVTGFIQSKNQDQTLNSFFQQKEDWNIEKVVQAKGIKKVVLEELISDTLKLKGYGACSPVQNELLNQTKTQLELWRKIDIYVSGSMVAVGGVFVGSTVARALYNYPLPLLENLCYLILALYIIYDLLKKFYLHHLTNQNQEVKNTVATS